MNKQTFTEYLIEKCIEDTHALDDMLPDVYEDWIANQDVEDIIDWAEKWATPHIRESKKQAVEDFVEFMKGRLFSIPMPIDKLKVIYNDLVDYSEEFLSTLESSDNRGNK